jgi:hypothetical protein
MAGVRKLLERGEADAAHPRVQHVSAYNMYHAYATSNGASQLRISELVWDAEGWPVSGGP